MMAPEEKAAEEAEEYKIAAQMKNVDYVWKERNP
jgi:hypothetical protein